VVDLRFEGQGRGSKIKVPFLVKSETKVKKPGMLQYVLAGRHGWKTRPDLETVNNEESAEN